MKYQSQQIGFRKFAPYIPSLLRSPVTGIQKLMGAHEDFVRVFLWKGQELRFANHPDFYRQILLDEAGSYSRSKSIFALKPFLGKGLFIAEGEDWKKQRLRLKPAFHGKLIKSYDRIIGEEVERAFQAWGERKHIELEMEVQVLTLRIMLRTLLHDKARTDEHRMIHALKDILFASGVLGQELQYLERASKKYLKASLPLYSNSEKALQWVRGETSRFIHFARENREEAGWFMNAMLDAVEAREIDEELIYDEVNSLLFAGFDTTAANVTWALHELSLNKKWQDRVREEAWASEGDSTEKVLRRSEARKVIQEALRLYPSAWGITRTAVKDSMLGGEIPIPKGAHLMLSPYALHRDPRYWESPGKFMPERFEQPLPHPFAYVPFGHGERICIGQQIAKIQATWILSAFVRDFRLTPPAKHQPVFTGGIILASKRPIIYGIEKEKPKRPFLQETKTTPPHNPKP